MTSKLSMLLIPPALLVLTTACARVGTELQPYVRPDAQGFTVTLHRLDEDEFQVVVWHPQGHFYAFAESPAPFQAKLVGDAMRPSTASTERTSFTQHTTQHPSLAGNLLGVSTQHTVRTEHVVRTARTCWSFDRARWQEGRPFRLVLIRGWEPLIPEKRMELEIALGKQVGSAEGLEVKILSQDRPPHGAATPVGSPATSQN